MRTFFLALAALALLPAAPAAQQTQSYEVAGVRVIHRQLAANDLIAVNLYLLGGSALLNADNAGIESMLLAVSEFGTARYPGREARLALARTGSQTVLQTRPDWTLFGFRGLRSEFAATWDVFTDRIMRPALDTAALELVRARMLVRARSNARNPDAIVRAMAEEAAFSGHAYAHRPEGSEESLNAITQDALRAFHQAHMVTSRMRLVVVGDITRAELEAALERTLGTLPRGEYTWTLPPSWGARTATVSARFQVLPTNYILGYFAGPPAADRDYHAFRMATILLSSFAFGAIREAGLSYAASAGFLDRGASGGSIYVTTTRPDTTMKVFNSAIDYLATETVSRPVLQRFYRGFMTDYYASNESVIDQADFLARYELLHGDWRASERYMDDLRAIQGMHIRNAVRRYFKNIQYVYLGNTDLVPTTELRKH